MGVNVKIANNDKYLIQYDTVLRVITVSFIYNLNLKIQINYNNIIVQYYLLVTILYYLHIIMTVIIRTHEYNKANVHKYDSIDKLVYCLVNIYH